MGKCPDPDPHPWPELMMISSSSGFELRIEGPSIPRGFVTAAVKPTHRPNRQKTNVDDNGCMFWSDGRKTLQDESISLANVAQSPVSSITQKPVSHPSVLQSDWKQRARRDGWAQITRLVLRSRTGNLAEMMWWDLSYSLKNVQRKIWLPSRWCEGWLHLYITQQQLHHRALPAFYFLSPSVVSEVSTSIRRRTQ